MSTLIDIHPESPQARNVAKVVRALANDGVIAYPTTSGYALGCKMSSLRAVERIRRIRQLQDKQDFTLMCADMSQASEYAKIDTPVFKFIKGLELGKFTFILNATSELPRKTNSKRGTVGIRLAASKSVQAILEALGEPMISASLLRPSEEEIEEGKTIHEGYSRGLYLMAFTSAWEVNEAMEGVRKRVELVVDSGEIEGIPSTVIDLTSGEADIVREGAGGVKL